MKLEDAIKSGKRHRNILPEHLSRYQDKVTWKPAVSLKDQEGLERGGQQQYTALDAVREWEIEPETFTFTRNQLLKAIGDTIKEVSSQKRISWVAPIEQIVLDEFQLFLNKLGMNNEGQN